MRMLLHIASINIKEIYPPMKIPWYFVIGSPFIATRIICTFYESTVIIDGNT